MAVIQIPLYGAKAAGRVALVDEADAPLVRRHRWHVMEWEMRGTRCGPYAATHTRRPDGRSTTLTMHKLITGYARTDHIDGDGLNNTRANLRDAGHAQNLRNRGATRSSTSGYKGVTYDRQTGQWKAQLTHQYRNIHLGRYPTPEDAARAYDAAAVKLHGVYARLNFA
jgi:hypothetical protein